MVIVASRSQPRQRVPGPNTADPKPDLERSRDAGYLPLAIAHELERLVPEGRKGRETTEEPDEEKRARRSGQDTARFIQAGKKPQHEAANHVDQEGFQRKRPARLHASDQSADLVAQHRAQETADANQEYLLQTSSCNEKMTPTEIR